MKSHHLYVKGFSFISVVFCIMAVFAVSVFSFTFLRPKMTIDIDVQRKSVERIGDLCLLKVFDEYVVTTNDENGIEGTFVARCDAILSLDFGKICISLTNDMYLVSFPAIEVKQPRVDRNGLQAYEVSKGLKNMFKSSDILRQSVLTEAENRIRREALSDRFIEKAKERATNIVSTLIRHGGNQDSIPITFNWQKSSTP